jgi:uncharacterized cupredoxin-like copper-binding protein
MTIRHTAIAAVSVVSLAAIIGPQAAGSGERGGAHAAATSVSVSGKEFKFTLSRRSAPHGSITFRFTNRGKIGHDFKIDGKKTRVIKPRKSASFTVRLKRGRYRYICTVPGHASSGMKGTFRVT